MLEIAELNTESKELVVLYLKYSAAVNFFLID